VPDAATRNMGLAELPDGLDPADLDGLLDRLDPDRISAYLLDLERRAQGARVLLRAARRRHKERDRRRTVALAKAPAGGPRR
jgi:hypothetical protein